MSWFEAGFNDQLLPGKALVNDHRQTARKTNMSDNDYFAMGAGAGMLESSETAVELQAELFAMPSDPNLPVGFRSFPDYIEPPIRSEFPASYRPEPPGNQLPYIQEPGQSLMDDDLSRSTAYEDVRLLFSGSSSLFGESWNGLSSHYSHSDGSLSDHVSGQFSDYGSFGIPTSQGSSCPSVAFDDRVDDSPPNLAPRPVDRDEEFQASTHVLQTTPSFTNPIASSLPRGNKSLFIGPDPNNLAPRTDWSQQSFHIGARSQPRELSGYFVGTSPSLSPDNGFLTSTSSWNDSPALNPLSPRKSQASIPSPLLDRNHPSMSTPMATEHSTQSYLTVPTRDRIRRYSDGSPQPSPYPLGNCMTRSISDRQLWRVLGGRSGPYKSQLKFSPQPIDPLNKSQKPKTSRGRRTGPMTEQGKAQARRKRRQKSTCIGCRTRKVACSDCSDQIPCMNCVKGSTSRGPKSCSPAHFRHLLYEGPTNLISQYCINHLQRDLVGRRRLIMPFTTFGQLVSKLGTIVGTFDFRVLQNRVQIYDLDLEGCLKFLSALHTKINFEVSFSALINTHLAAKCSKKDDWTQCLKNGESLRNCDLNTLMENLITWNNMPSRLSFVLVDKLTGSQRLLDPDDEHDKSGICAAAQLSGMVGRLLEIKTYNALQTYLNGCPMVTSHFLERLAQLLLTLRWRISWWRLLGNGLTYYGPRHQPGIFIDRVGQLCKILYMYYCFYLRERVQRNADCPIKMGQRSCYPDTARLVDEYYPKDESHDGYERWMREGEAKIYEAGVLEQLRTVGLL